MTKEGVKTRLAMQKTGVSLKNVKKEKQPPVSKVSKPTKVFARKQGGCRKQQIAPKPSPLPKIVEEEDKEEEEKEDVVEDVTEETRFNELQMDLPSDDEAEEKATQGLGDLVRALVAESTTPLPKRVPQLAVS
ncbi:unnamed protein product [Cochlearia groenlandica]